MQSYSLPKSSSAQRLIRSILSMITNQRGCFLALLVHNSIFHINGFLACTSLGLGTWSQRDNVLSKFSTHSSLNHSNAQKSSFLSNIHGDDKHKDRKRHLTPQGLVAIASREDRETYTKCNKSNDINLPPPRVDFSAQHGILLPPKAVASK